MTGNAPNGLMLLGQFAGLCGMHLSFQELPKHDEAKAFADGASSGRLTKFLLAITHDFADTIE